MKAILIMGSTADEPHAKKITDKLDDFGIDWEQHAASAHKQPLKVLEILDNNKTKKDIVYIDNSTVSAEISRELYKAAKDKGFDFLDAPISGGQPGAESGKLTVMVGGDEKIFSKAKPIIDCYSQKVNLIGPSGSGQLTKMMNQMCIAGAVQGLSEAINFGINAGLDMDKVMDTISKGAAQSWQMENRYRSCLLYTSPSPRDVEESRMPSSA